MARRRADIRGLRFQPPIDSWAPGRFGQRQGCPRGLVFFLLGAVNFCGTEVSTVGVALATVGVSLHSLLFHAMGSGLLLGIAGSRVLLASKFAKA